MSENGCPKTGPKRAKGSCPLAWQKRVNRTAGLTQHLKDSKEKMAKAQAEAAAQVEAPSTSPVKTPMSVLADDLQIKTTASVPDADTTITANVETVVVEANGGAFWLFSSFLFLGVIAAALYWWYKKRAGKRRSTRKPRTWEIVRMQSVTDQDAVGHSHYRPSMERSSTCRYRTSVASRSAMPALNRSLSTGSYTEVPISTHEPSTWERVSKGGKLN